MKKVEIYTVNYCPFCHKAKEILSANEIVFKEIDITENEDAYRKELGDYYGIKGVVTVPQIIIGGKLIGGCDRLEELNASGELNKLLEDE